jgi:hypothetical protein
MSAIDAREGAGSWRKATRSAGNGECVEVASATGRVRIRDSKDPEGPVLSYTSDAFRSFLDVTKKVTASQ